MEKVKNTLVHGVICIRQKQGGPIAIKLCVSFWGEKFYRSLPFYRIPTVLQTFFVFAIKSDGRDLPILLSMGLAVNCIAE